MGIGRREEFDFGDECLCFGLFWFVLVCFGFVLVLFWFWFGFWFWFWFKES